MFKTIFHTNLDLAFGDKCQWPQQLPFIPQVGNLIRSSYVHPGTYDRDPNSPGYNKVIIGKGVQLELEVYRIMIVAPDKEGWGHGHLSHIEVELHLPKGRYESLRTFYNWYEKVTGKKFI